MIKDAVEAKRPAKTREHRCMRCGYRISSHTKPARCPMCHASDSWRSLPERRPGTWTQR